VSDFAHPCVILISTSAHSAFPKRPLPWKSCTAAPFHGFPCMLGHWCYFKAVCWIKCASNSAEAGGGWVLDEENRLEWARLGHAIQSTAIEGKKFIESWVPSENQCACLPPCCPTSFR